MKVLSVVLLGFGVCVALISSLRSGLHNSNIMSAGAVELLGTQRNVQKARMAMLADPPECVSWRGCSQSYDPETMATSTFYDRFDSYPNAWDATPAAKTLRATYPNGFPATDDPTVIVSGDPLHAWPNQDFGVGFQGSYSPFKAFDSYYY
jgi:hypothetical protein